MNMDNESYRAFWDTQVGRVVKVMEDWSARARRENTEQGEASDGARLRCAAPAAPAGVLPHCEASPASPAAWTQEQINAAAAIRFSAEADPLVNVCAEIAKHAHLFLPAPAPSPSAQAGPSRDELAELLKRTEARMYVSGSQVDERPWHVVCADAVLEAFGPVLAARDRLIAQAEGDRDAYRKALTLAQKQRDAAVAEAARLRGELEKTEKQRDHWRKENSARMEDLAEERESVRLLKADIEKRRSAGPAALDRVTPRMFRDAYNEAFDRKPSDFDDYARMDEVDTKIAAALNKRLGAAPSAAATDQSSGNPGTLPAAPPPSETRADAMDRYACAEDLAIYVRAFGGGNCSVVQLDNVLAKHWPTPNAVRLPDRHTDLLALSARDYREGWNACIGEVERLNSGGAPGCAAQANPASVSKTHESPGAPLPHWTDTAPQPSTTAPKPAPPASAAISDEAVEKLAAAIVADDHEIHTESSWLERVKATIRSHLAPATIRMPDSSELKIEGGLALAGWHAAMEAVRKANPGLAREPASKEAERG